MPFLPPTRPLDGIVPQTLATQYDARELIARLVDGSELDEFKKTYGATIVTGAANAVAVAVETTSGRSMTARAMRRMSLIEPSY